MSARDEVPAEISPDRFDSDRIWQSLTDERKAMIGRAALDLVAARNCLEETYPGGPRQTPAHRAAQAAMDAADQQIDDFFVLCVPQRFLTDDEDRVKLPECVGMVCRECGCTQEDACDEGCAWAEDSLCTSCDKAKPGEGGGS